MKNPVPWKLENEPLHHDVRRASGLLEQGFPEPEWSPQEKNEVWRKLSAQIPDQAGVSRPWLPVFAVTGWGLAAVAAAALVVIRLPHAAPKAATPVGAMASANAFDDRTADWEPLSLGSEGKLRVKPGSRLELTAGQPAGSSAGVAVARKILLREGELCAQITHRDVPLQGPLIVEAPQMKVVVIGTKFCFDTGAGVAHVNVSEGRVRVETPGGMSQEVGSGEEMRSDDLRLRAAMPSVPSVTPSLVVAPMEAPAVEGCAGLSGAERAACYGHVANGSGLAAQNALYGLGLLARERHEGEAALHQWREYQRRFPKGVLAPEASLGILGELINQRRYSEAVDEADRYLKENPDGLVAEVMLAKAEILQTGLNSPDSALPLYLGLLTGELAPPVRQEVLYSMGLCERQEGYESEAHELWRRYLTSFPRGPHATQVTGLLGAQQ
jgi:ferric-dicitrate binding protein FerR (iron transport regulator)